MFSSPLLLAPVLQASKTQTFFLHLFFLKKKEANLLSDLPGPDSKAVQLTLQ
jgi:hypothetical protein